MIIQNKHFPKQLKSTKRIIQIDLDRPLTVVLSQRFPFLNSTLICVLTEYGYAYTVKQADQKQIMQHVLPIICCQDVVLQKQALVQFLADIALGQYQFVEYMQRKLNLIKLYKSWFSLLHNQYQQDFTLPHIEDLTKHQHTNKAFEQFINISIFVVNKGYQRIFPTYEPLNFNIQSILVADVTYTIIDYFPRTSLDYILRGYFNAQIDYSIAYKMKSAERLKEEPQNLTKRILMDGQEPKLQIYPVKNTNLVWFTCLLVGLGVVYARYGE